MPGERRVAAVTGASSGIGAACARALAGCGFHVVVGARRLDRLQDLAALIDGTAQRLDVTDVASVEEFMAAVVSGPGRLDLLVNNAGLALNQDPIASVADSDLTQMWETNVLGVLRTTRAALPLLRKAPSAHIINIGSTAGFDNYPGGIGYTASKHALRAITQTLRLELNGEPIRVTEIAPGLTRTEFRFVRFPHDRERALAGYAGMEPLTPEDVADCVAFAATRPPNVDIDYMVVRPVAQATSWQVARRKD